MNEIDTKKLIDELKIKYNGFNVAYTLASEGHKDQKRIDGRPYMTHIDGVIVAVYTKISPHTEKSVIEKCLIVAALHDLYEDHPEAYPLSLIELKLSPFLSKAGLSHVIKSITLISKSKEFPKPYDKYILDIAKHVITRFVKIEDLIYNLNDDPKKFIGKQSLKDKYELSLYFLQNYPDFGTDEED